MIRVTVPASTANIGPGFDTLGMALNMYNVYEFEKTDEGLSIEGCPQEYNNTDNLIYRAVLACAQAMGADVGGLTIRINSDIPVSRGLGSSAACIVGGVFGACALYGGKLSKDELFSIATAMEGHPDNIAPAIYGGLTASVMSGERPCHVSYSVHPDLCFCALVPDFEISTGSARQMLPHEVRFADAVFNVSMVSVLLKSLEIGDMEMIRISLRDALHQPYRKRLIYEYEEIERICVGKNGSAMFISGSGPTLMNITGNSCFTNVIKDDIMKLSGNWRIRLLKADTNGVRTEIIP